MSTPFSLIWSDVSNNVLTKSWFPIGFPGTNSPPLQLQVGTNTTSLSTFNTLIDVAFYLTGDITDIDTIQNEWPTLGGSTRPELSGGLDISFDFGSTYIRFDSTHGVESDPTTWITLPAEAVGIQGADGILGAFDLAHLLVRVVVPPNVTEFKKFDIRLALGFDII
jgi:hypothetical protein